MKQRSTCLVATLALFLAVAVPALAQDDMGAKPELSGYLASFKADYEGVTKKLVDLAKATPADKFGWRPAEGVRSVSEVYVHVAGANFFLANALGVPMPEGFSRDAEKTVTGKDAVIALLEKSIEHVHQAVAAKAGADLDEKLTVFGSERPARAVFLIIAGHAHEHLGQSIAYARMSGVVPPWSAGGGEG